MKKTRKVLRRYWDVRFASFVKASFETVEKEISEHFVFTKWVLRYVLLPVSIFYILLGLLFGIRVLPALALGFIVFLYSNFLPDFDSLLTPTDSPEKRRKSTAERFGLLFFGLLFVYYLLSGKAKPIYCRKKKEFHDLKHLLAYCLFLLLVGALFWDNSVRIFVLPLFGGLGYATHLLVDGYLKLRWQ